MFRNLPADEAVMALENAEIEGTWVNQLYTKIIQIEGDIQFGVKSPLANNTQLEAQNH